MAQNGIFGKMFSYNKWRFLSKLLLPIVSIILVAMIAFLTIAIAISTSSLEKLSFNSLVANAHSGTDIIGTAIKTKIDEMELHSSKNVFVNALLEASTWSMQRKSQEYENSLDLANYKAKNPNPDLYKNNFNFYNSREYLEIMKERFGFKEVMITDLNGMTIIATNKLSDPNNKNDDWFVNCKDGFFKEGKIVSVEPPEYDDSAEAFSLSITAPIIRLGEKQPAGFLSTRYLCSSAFETVDHMNERFKEDGSSTALGWISQDAMTLESVDKHLVGNNIGNTPKYGPIYEQYLIKDGGYIKDGKYFNKENKEQKLATSDVWKMYEKYSTKYKEFKNYEKTLLEGYNFNTKKEQKDHLKNNEKWVNLSEEIIELQKGSGLSSTGVPRSYGIATIGKDQGLPDGIYGYVFTRIDQPEYTKPINNLQLILIVLMLVILIIITIILTFISRSVVFPILTLRGALLEVSYGNYDVTVPVKSEDEIGEVSKTFNQLLKDIRGYISTDEDRQRQERQVSNMLGVVSSMSSGDLTKEAEVTADVMGAVADSINFMAQQLKGIINQVSEVSTNIGSSSSEILASTEHLSKGAQQQHDLITDTSAAVDEMAISINQVSQSAESAANAAQNSAQIAETGGNTVGEAVEGMNKIRSSVAEISKRIKKLGESSQEIGEIVNVISDIAGQTNMLALNAAIEAARAGEQGRGFAVVADAVRQLAERSSKATKDIALLIKSIQAETQEAVKVMEDSTTEVVEGSKLAENAKQKLDEIITNSKQLAELISSISLSSRQQSRATEEVNKAMTSISEITTQTTTGIVQAAESVGEMARLAEMLQEQIKRFKV
jgi:methyl-accepting chemotaxis protein